MPANRPGPGRPKRTGPPRKGGQPRTPPGLAEIPPSEQPEFIEWKAKYNPVGSYPEFLVFEWLRKHGYTPGLDFRYLPVVGGARQFEGVQIDFVVRNWLALAIDGVYFHFRTPEQRASGFLARATAQSAGLTYVSLLDGNVVNALDVTMRLALVGAEMPGTSTGQPLNG